MPTSDWHPNGLAAFFKSDYTFGDAQKLAELWGIPVGEAKQVLGHKIIRNIEGLLPKVIGAPNASSKWDLDSLTSFLRVITLMMMLLS